MEIPSGVTEIGEQAFYNCSNLEQIWIPEEITYIGKEAFKGCRKAKIRFPYFIKQWNISKFVDDYARYSFY